MTDSLHPVKTEANKTLGVVFIGMFCFIMGMAFAIHTVEGAERRLSE